MQGTARNFFTMAVIYSLLGMMLGLSMAMSHDHSQLPTHAHIMVLGWLMSAVFAFFYHLVPAARASRLAIVHFWIAAASSIGMFVGLFVLYGGNPAIEPVLAVSALAYFASTLLFAFIALSALWRGHSARAVGEPAAV
jgi:cbb3-type cytochrome oxidase subunit 1